MEWGDAEKVVLEYARRGSPAPFLVKTYMAVEDPLTDHIVSWNGDGTAFVVWQPAEFARDLLPTLFKHSNFSSFVRQLNTYGFSKVAGNRWEFCNKLFRRGKQDKLRQIFRKKATYSKPLSKAQLQGTPASDDHDDLPSLSVSSSPSEVLDNLVYENNRLRQENDALRSEVTNMKKKFDELLDFVAGYGGMGGPKI